MFPETLRAERMSQAKKSCSRSSKLEDFGLKFRTSHVCATKHVSCLSLSTLASFFRTDSFAPWSFPGDDKASPFNPPWICNLTMVKLDGFSTKFRIGEDRRSTYGEKASAHTKYASRPPRESRVCAMTKVGRISELANLLEYQTCTRERISWPLCF